MSSLDASLAQLDGVDMSDSEIITKYIKMNSAKCSEPLEKKLADCGGFFMRRRLLLSQFDCSLRARLIRLMMGDMSEDEDDDDSDDDCIEVDVNEEEIDDVKLEANQMDVEDNQALLPPPEGDLNASFFEVRASHEDMCVSPPHQLNDQNLWSVHHNAEVKDMETNALREDNEQWPLHCDFSFSSEFEDTRPSKDYYAFEPIERLRSRHQQMRLKPLVDDESTFFKQEKDIADDSSYGACSAEQFEDLESRASMENVVQGFAELRLQPLDEPMQQVVHVSHVSVQQLQPRKRRVDDMPPCLDEEDEDHSKRRKV